ncbi:MAG: response regulator transcription factor [Actinobacteria bacterium]|nr:response regulator transcription factor [Actinomycetota bacterium]
MDELLLIAEDDASLREVTRLGLQAEGYRVVEAADGPSALDAVSRHEPDLVLLDVMLPGLDGFEVCRRVRRTSLVPIVMLTARSSTVDVVVGLESGADDYVTKPFELPELVARIRSVLRRAGTRPPPTDDAPGGAGASEELRLDGLAIDEVAHEVTRDGVPVALTATEFRLLVELVRHRGQVLTRDQLLDRVWGYTYLGDSRLVDVHIQRLRAKIEADQAEPALILTVRGVGYKAKR